jgi:two-component system cell cycle response regulator DivK
MLSVSRESTPLHSASVLIVEDDPPSLKLLTVVLEREGCDVHSTRTAEDALVVLRTIRPRVVIIDLVLPLMGGLLLAENLKADAATADIPLIAVTAFNGREAEQIAKAAGFALYVRKPVDPDIFPELVLSVLGGGK